MKVLLAILSLVLLSSPQSSTVSYKVPTGWKESAQTNGKALVPGDLKEGELLVVIAGNDESATSETPEKQFSAMAAKANGSGKELAKGEVSKLDKGGNTIVVQAFQLDDPELGNHARMVAGVFNGGRRITFVVIMSSAEVVSRYDAAMMDIFGSVKFKPAPKPTEGTASGKAPTGNTPDLFPGMPGWLPSGNGMTVPETKLTSKGPQGVWYILDFTSNIARATPFVFFTEGVIVSNPRWGGGNIVDVAEQKRITPSSVGTWSVSDGKITVQNGGFEARTGEFQTGKDDSGIFFKRGKAMYRPIQPPTASKVVGKWRTLNTQYEFRADGTFSFGQVSSGDDWVANSVTGGTYFLDGRLAVMKYTGLHTNIVPIGFITDKQIMIGTALLNKV